ncbi:MAG: DUF711 family protein [Candidatus Levybacteria bacterium]|nr:DUF711 family protein [Candidatus Levybacteria bacterium]
MAQKIIRTVCAFTDNLTNDTITKVKDVHSQLEKQGYIIQTKRICVDTKNFQPLKLFDDGSIFLSLGTLTPQEAPQILSDFYASKNVSFNIDLTNEDITQKHTQILFDVIQNKPSKTFNFTYVFNNSHSSPFFPSATYNTNSYSIGLQPTDLAEGCESIDEWLESMKTIWNEIHTLFSNDPDFLGIDSSIAPLFQGSSSFINFIRRLGIAFPQSTTTDIYMKITKFIKAENPKPIGLNGLMFPCLEDFELAEEYEKGEFSIERNVYLSLHSGLGIDTYPIAVDEEKERVVDILKLVQGFSNKYKKPLSARFVSDGKSKLGEKTDFQHQYLKDVVLRSL